MTALRCKPGDLAIVIDAYNTSNLGMIVRVVGPQDLSSDLVIQDESGVWVIESPHLMAWAIGERIIYRKRGPVLDSQLKPIRGLPLEKDSTQSVNDLVREN
jgi:hypothetical protein